MIPASLVVEESPPAVLAASRLTFFGILLVTVELDAEIVVRARPLGLHPNGCHSRGLGRATFGSEPSDLQVPIVHPLNCPQNGTIAAHVDQTRRDVGPHRRVEGDPGRNS